jgi:two-component system chemotaxis response regulator CheB
LELGAFDFVCKPKVSTQVGDMAEELISRVKGAARSRAVTLIAAENGIGQVTAAGRKKRRPKSTLHDSSKIIAIGASSGGPHALRYLLPRIPSDVNAPILIVQHMMESFTPTFVRWLDEICDMEVKEARDGDVAIPGKILVAPGGHHMTVNKTALGAQIVLEGGEAVSGHKPSVDVLFQSVAREYGLLGIGLIMTGMGSDGAQGINEIRKAGGHTVAQDRESCSVYGMPRVAIEKGYIDTVLPLKDMPEYLVSVVGQQSV